ncbi:MAG TPA: hypothetical protein VLD59_08885 [Steroidobacteraceae bacterium]|nr:hypothetical protein [Steroidobacteraceae bacterium]
MFDRKAVSITSIRTVDILRLPATKIRFTVRPQMGQSTLERFPAIPTMIRRFPSQERGKMVRYAAAPVAKMFMFRSYVINHGTVPTRF